MPYSGLTLEKVVELLDFIFIIITAEFTWTAIATVNSWVLIFRYLSLATQDCIFTLSADNAHRIFTCTKKRRRRNLTTKLRFIQVIFVVSTSSLVYVRRCCWGPFNLLSALWILAKIEASSQCLNRFPLQSTCILHSIAPLGSIFTSSDCLACPM